MHRIVITLAFLALSCSCRHNKNPLINEYLGSGYVLEATNRTEELALYDKEKEIISAPVIGYSYDESRIIIFKKTKKILIMKGNGSIMETPYKDDVINRPDTDGGLKVHWYSN